MNNIVFNNKKIHYHKMGTGPIVVLLHGFGENGAVWNRQASALKKDYTLIIPDVPGSGTSEPLTGNQTLDNYAEVLESIMEIESRDEKFTLFGHSMGGYITMAYLEKFGDRLNAFGLIHSSAFADTSEKIETRKKGIEFIKNNGGAAFMKAMVPNLFSEKSKEDHPEFINELLALSSDISDQGLIQYYNAMIQRPDRSALLSSVNVPVLFEIGRYDTAIPFEISMKQCHLPAISDVNILGNSGHMGMWEETEKTNESMRRFLSNLSL